MIVFRNFFLELFLPWMSNLKKKKRGIYGWDRSNFEHITLDDIFTLLVNFGYFEVTRENLTPNITQNETVTLMFLTLS